MLAVAHELKRVPDRVRLLDVGGAAAVLAVVDPLVSRKGILDPAKVHPDARVLMDEERAAVEQFVAEKAGTSIDTSMGFTPAAKTPPNST